MPSKAGLAWITVLLGTLISVCEASTYTVKIGLNGQTCFSQPISFNYRTFSYTLRLQSSTQLGNGCSGSEILVSPLYMQNTCLNPRNNESSGCSNGGTTVTGSISTAGTRVPINDTADICNQAFSQNGPASTVEQAASSGSIYDQGSLTCTPTTYGFLYFQNNCPAETGNSIFTVQVDFNAYSRSCSGSSYSSYYYGGSGGWPGWATWSIIVGSVFFLVLFGLMCCRRRRRMQGPAVQMMPVGSAPPTMPPPPQYTGGGYQGPPPGYPGPPPGYPPNHAEYGAQPSSPSPAVGMPAVWFAGGKPPAASNYGPTV